MLKVTIGFKMVPVRTEVGFQGKVRLEMTALKVHAWLEWSLVKDV